ncbi:DsbA family protein [Couchioplanes azureus]|uniref:DsbA family protein n=1 Tax=Couchioplanes caeruleus TaxID=56438 RepID=UPI00166FC26D|nr:DsbA family protein [Couchioplanes caeruleus]GGQ50382.1 DSBA oxidoreductase [Couchioplanes caeruleus subsp. azureus]
MEVTYFFDPACPFSWRTSRWLVAVAPERDLTLRWRAFSLTILNGGDVPEAHRAAAAASSRALRLVEALRADHRDDAAAAFYAELGTRSHEAGVPVSDGIVAQAATAAGIADAGALLDDASWDEAVRESHELAFGSAGPDVGSPVLLVEGAGRAVHGPVIGDVPARAEALAIWDAVVALARSDTFFTLTRGRS